MTVALFLMDMPLHVLNDYNGVVDDQTRGQRDAKHRKRVDGKAKDLDKGEGTDERNGNRYGGNDRCSPVLQEEVDDDDDDDDGFEDRLNYFLDRIPDYRRCIEGDNVVKSRRK